MDFYSQTSSKEDLKEGGKGGGNWTRCLGSKNLGSNGLRERDCNSKFFS